MVWWKASDDFADQPAVTALSDSAFRLLVEGSLRSSRFLTDGVLDGRWVAQQVAGRWPGIHPEDELVAIGLWERNEGGFTIVNFLQDQPSKATVTARRESERIKKQNQRAPRPGGTTAGTADGSPGTGDGDDLYLPKLELGSSSSSPSSRTPEGCPDGTTEGTPKTLAFFEKTTGHRLYNGQLGQLERLEAVHGEVAVREFIQVAATANAGNPLAYVDKCLQDAAASPDAGPAENPFKASQARIDASRRAHRERERTREPLEAPL